MPPPLSTPSHLDAVALLCKDESLPRELRAKSEIQRQVAQYMTLLDAQVDARTRHSLITVFEQELDRTRATFGDLVVEELDVEVLAAKIYLYGFTFVNNRSLDRTTPHTELSLLAKRETLQRGLAAAIRLLHYARHLRLPGVMAVSTPEGHPSSPEYLYQLGFYPKHFFYTVFVANIFLLWFLAVDLQASDTDKELARTYVAASHRLFSSYTNNAELMRCARIMEVLGRMPNVNGRSPSLRVNSRLGASFMYDAIYNATFYRHAMAQASAASEAANLTTSAPPSEHSNAGLGVRRDLLVVRPSPMPMAVPGGGAGTDAANIGRHMNHDGCINGGHMVKMAGVETPDVYGMMPDMTDGAQTVEFPWGVWDNAIYDDLNMGMELEQIAYEAQPYWQ